MNIKIDNLTLEESLEALNYFIKQKHGREGAYVGVNGAQPAWGTG